MTIKTTPLEMFQKALTLIAAKRFSPLEKTILIIIVAAALFIGNRQITNWIHTAQNKTRIIELTSPSVKPGTNALPQPPGLPSPVPKPQTQEIKPETVMRDPFLASKNPEKQQPAVMQHKAVVELKVSGILWDEQIPTAIINSQVVKVGDIIGGKTVVDMEKDSVMLMENGELLILKLHKD